MKYFSSRDPNYVVDAEQAIVGNLCPRGGLFMPQELPNLSFQGDSKRREIADFGFEIAKIFFGDSFGSDDLKAACERAFNFPAPIVSLSRELHVLELTHGPSLAFKDFGARFMAECLALVAKKRSQRFTVLTATSGDTGAAVAAALQGKEGVEVVILYPHGRISNFQESQMTKWRGNVKTVAVKGSFDDCQRLVKAAFSDSALARKAKLVSANSINISRLLAQTTYYLSALQHFAYSPETRFVVPSGNLGNLTAGIFAARMLQLPLEFVAGLNRNRTFAEYLSTGKYDGRPSVPTPSNAMDVGAPSNFERLELLFNQNVSEMRRQIQAEVVSDEETIEEIQSVYRRYSYVACPHTAVGLRAAERSQTHGLTIVLATAHPSKFSDVLDAAGVPVPDVSFERVPPTIAIEPHLEHLVPIF